VTVVERATAVPDETRDLLALVDVLSEMVEEAFVHGTLMGLELRYAPVLNEVYEDDGPYWPAMRLCYGEIDPDGTMGDDEFAVAMEESEKPHRERVWAWRERFRAQLARNDDA